MVFGPAGLLDMHDAKMGRAIGKSGGGGEHPRDGSITSLQSGKRETGLRVVVIEQVNEFVGGRVGFRIVLVIAFRVVEGRVERRERSVHPRPKHIGGGASGRTFVGHGKTRATSALHEIVDQTNPVAGGDGQHLVFTIRVEGGKTNFAGIGTREVEDRFATGVANMELASRV